MKIFASEKEIEKQIKSNKSIAYNMQIEKTSNEKDFPNYFFPLSSLDKENFSEVIKASIQDKELFYHTSILVSTTINKNDDVFLPEVVWTARNTPVHKPTNLEHDNNKIIGHMTGSWAIDVDGNKVEETKDLTELPKKFHILVGSVIYKYWPNNDEYTVRVGELLEAIEKGEKYVSMECRFKNFDYVLASENDTQIIKRNEDTAFLSKYLRAYGGSGQYKDYRVARVVRDISFCGKGYVNKPANPESVIFTKDDIQDFSKASYSEKICVSQNNGVINNSAVSQEDPVQTEKIEMSEFYAEQNKELKTANATLTSQVEELRDKLTQSNVTKLEKEIENLKTEAKDVSDVLKTKTEVLSAKENDLKEIQKKFDETSKAHEALIKTNTELSEQLNKIEAESKTQLRISTLVEGGFSKEDAVAKVTKFSTLNDEQFAEISKDLIEAAMYKKEKDKSDKKPEGKKKEDEAKADVENAEITDDEVTSAAATTEDKSIVSDIAKNLSAYLKTQDKDGDK